MIIPTLCRHALCYIYLLITFAKKIQHQIHQLLSEQINLLANPEQPSEGKQRRSKTHIYCTLVELDGLFMNGLYQECCLK